MIKRKRDLSVVWNLRAIPIAAVLKYYGTKIPYHSKDKPYKVFCPFHGETKPSFTVYPENNSFYCFSCNVGGDSIHFIREKEQVRFLPALKILAKIGGYDLPLDLLKEIAQSFGGVWQDAKKTKEIYEARRKEDWKKLTIKMSAELTKIYQNFPGWIKHRQEVEWIWEEYDDIMHEPLTMKRFDSLKDWYWKSRKFLLKRVKLWVELEIFKREVYEERVGFLMNRRIK